MSIATPTFNSVTISGTVATLNCTPPVDVAYDHIQILYRKYGSSSFILGATFTGAQGVAANQTQSGLVDGLLYEFALVSVDADDNYSLPSNTRSARNTDSIAEKNMFLDNAQILLANCPTFQSWTNSIDADAALLRIHEREYNLRVESPLFPMATVYFEGDAQTRSEDSDNQIMNTDINIKFTESCSSERDRDEKTICRNHFNTVQKIMHELRQRQGTDAFLIVPETKEMQEPMFMNLTDDEEELTQDFVFSIHILICGVK